MCENLENIDYKKKPLDPKLNKLFITWIEEMTKEAKKSKHQSYFTFKKALAAIKKYPIKLKSGKDCAILEGFGEKICATLDKKLADLAKSKGLSLRKALRMGNKELSKDHKPSISQSFLPKQGSGCYSMIFALKELDLLRGADDNGFLKKDIVVASEKYLQSSVDSDGDEKQISWSNMKTLINKDLVIKSGKSYKLSESGLVLYIQLKNSTETIKQTSDGGVSLDEKRTRQTGDDKTLQLYYCKYIDASNFEMVNLKSFAASKIENGIKYFRVKIRREHLTANMKYIYDFDTRCDNDEFLFVFLSDKDAPQLGCSFQENTALSSTDLKSQPIVKSNRKAPEFKVPQALPLLKEIAFDSHLHNAPAMTTKSDTITTSLYRMTNHTFEIILIVDSRENYGVGKLKDYLCPKLQSNGIKFEVRPIPVGDFLWIAKDNSGREAVLDIIVERKRFDDLCASIIDNRFKDQKLRMKRLGLSRILYLVEKCSSMKNLKIEFVSLCQTLVNSQIHDNCDVKVTENGADTVEYLTMLTRKLSDLHSSQEIEVFGSFTTAANNASSCRALDYAAFTQSSQKTKPLKVSEMFAKHLMCITGVTPEKAKAVIDRFPVPRLLIETYRKCDKEKTCWSLLSEIKLSGNRKFGLAASKAIYCAYSKK